MNKIDMNREDIVTDFTGLFVLIVGTISLFEAFLQTSLLGGQLPFIQGVLVSVFAVGFGLCLLTEEASNTFREFKDLYLA